MSSSMKEGLFIYSHFSLVTHRKRQKYDHIGGKIATTYQIITSLKRMSLLSFPRTVEKRQTFSWTGKLTI